MTRRILVPLDGSARSPDVLAAAMELGRNTGGELFPFRAIEVPPDFSAAGSPPDGFEKYQSDKALRELQDVVASASARGVPIGGFGVRAGQAWRAIVDVADELDVDFIVMGNHGHSGWERVLGTTVGKVAKLTSHNVLIVYDGDEQGTVSTQGPSTSAEGRSGPAGHPIRTILVGLDESPRAPRVLGVAVELAAGFGAELVPFHVVPGGKEVTASGHQGNDQGSRAEAETVRRLSLLTDAAANAVPTVRVAPPVVRTGVPWQSTLVFAEERNADLIVIGSHGDCALDFLLGTTANRIVNFARRNVLIVHAT